MVLENGKQKTIYFTKEFRKELGRSFLITYSMFDLNDSSKFITVDDGSEFVTINKNMILSIVESKK